MNDELFAFLFSQVKAHCVLTTLPYYAIKSNSGIFICILVLHHEGPNSSFQQLHVTCDASYINNEGR